MGSLTGTTRTITLPASPLVGDLVEIHAQIIDGSSLLRVALATNGDQIAIGTLHNNYTKPASNGIESPNSSSYNSVAIRCVSAAGAGTIKWQVSSIVEGSNAWKSW